MNRIGLLLDFLGFVMLFWQSAARPGRKLKDGGGSGTTSADEIIQMEKTLKWIPSKSMNYFLASRWQMIAFGLISLGAFFQLISCS